MIAKKDVAAELAEKMVQVLEAQRCLGGDDYPLTLRRLAELTDASAPAALILKASTLRKLFTDRVIVSKSKQLDALVALVEDAERLAACPALLEYVLRLTRTASNHAATVSQLKDKVTLKLKKAFQQAITRQIDQESLPRTLGWLIINRSKKLFLLSDLHTCGQMAKVAAQPVDEHDSPPELQSASAGTCADFAERFDQAFRRLEQHARMPNFVSLVDLRWALPCERPTFDAELRKLRIAGRYTLSAAEGREGIRPEEREAGIPEDGALLLYVSRKQP